MHPVTRSARLMQRLYTFILVIPLFNPSSESAATGSLITSIRLPSPGHPLPPSLPLSQPLSRSEGGRRELMVLIARLTQLASVSGDKSVGLSSICADQL